MMTINPAAVQAGQFEIGGDITINRLGSGAMRITGRNIWGEPEDAATAERATSCMPGS